MSFCIYDPVIRDRGPPRPQWYGGVGGRLSGPPPQHHRGEGSIYSIHTLHIQYTQCTQYTLYTLPQTTPSTPQGGGIYIQYIYIYMLRIQYTTYSSDIHWTPYIYTIYITYIHIYTLYTFYRSILYRPFTIAGGRRGPRDTGSYIYIYSICGLGSKIEWLIMTCIYPSLI